MKHILFCVLLACLALNGWAEQFPVYTENGGKVALEEVLIADLAGIADQKQRSVLKPSEPVSRKDQQLKNAAKEALVDDPDILSEIDRLRPAVPAGFGSEKDVFLGQTAEIGSKHNEDESAVRSDKVAPPVVQVEQVKVEAPILDNKRAKLVVAGQKEEPFPPPLPQAHALKSSLFGEKRAESVVNNVDDPGDTIFIAVTAVCTAAAVFGLVAAGVFWYRLHRQYKSAQETEYPRYGITGPTKERTSGNNSPTAAIDAKLAGQAQLYHYHHTKQQIIQMEQSHADVKGNESEDSEEEGDEGDFSVYECPGLAPTGDIEISNPLFESTCSPNVHGSKADIRKEP